MIKGESCSAYTKFEEIAVSDYLKANIGVVK